MGNLRQKSTLPRQCVYLEFIHCIVKLTNVLTHALRSIGHYEFEGFFANHALVSLENLSTGIGVMSPSSSNIRTMFRSSAQHAL